MPPETLRPLGSGIATAKPDQPLDDTIRIHYAPSEHALPMLRTLGYALFSIDEDKAMKELRIGSLGTSPSGDVWRKDESGQAVMVASRLDLHSALDTVKKFGHESTLNEFEDKHTGRRILIRTMPGSPYELWLPKTEADIPVLVDAVYCVHFHRPAADANGTPMSEQQILQEAHQVGVTFFMSPKGDPLLPQLSEK